MCMGLWKKWHNLYKKGGQSASYSKQECSKTDWELLVLQCLTQEQLGFQQKNDKFKTEENTCFKK